MNCGAIVWMAIGVVVERVVEEDRLIGRVARGVVAGCGVDVHALARVGDRVVVHVEVDRLADEAAAGREGRVRGAGQAGPVAIEGIERSGWTNTAASEKSERLESAIVNIIAELIWLTGRDSR